VESTTKFCHSTLPKTLEKLFCSGYKWPTACHSLKQYLDKTHIHFIDTDPETSSIFSCNFRTDVPRLDRRDYTVLTRSDELKTPSASPFWNIIWKQLIWKECEKIKARNNLNIKIRVQALEKILRNQTESVEISPRLELNDDILPDRVRGPQLNGLVETKQHIPVVPQDLRHDRVNEPDLDGIVESIKSLESTSTLASMYFALRNGDGNNDPNDDVEL
jgi:hypothetical protein